MLDHLLLHEHALPLPNLVDVDLRNIRLVRLFTKVLEFLFGRRNPEWILIEHFEAVDRVRSQF